MSEGRARSTRGRLATLLALVSVAVAHGAAVAAAQPGPVSWWRADGDATDSVGTNDGILTGTQPASGWFVGGPLGDPDGRAFNLNGSDDYVDVPNAPSQNITGAISLSAWVDWSADFSTSTGGPVIAGKYDTHDVQTSYFLSILNHGQVEWLVSSDCDSLSGRGSRSVITASAVVHLGEWTHIAGTFDPATQALHVLVDGAPVATEVDDSATVASLCQSNTDFRIGAAEDVYGALQFFPGAIDESSSTTET